VQLRVARLCLDCEELHTDEHCPVCGSEAFAWVTRWVPVTERRTRVRPKPAPSEAPPARRSRWITAGTAGLAMFAAARWFWRAGETGASAQSGNEGRSKSAPPSPQPHDEQKTNLLR